MGGQLEVEEAMPLVPPCWLAHLLCLPCASLCPPHLDTCILALCSWTSQLPEVQTKQAFRFCKSPSLWHTLYIREQRHHLLASNSLDITDYLQSCLPNPICSSFSPVVSPKHITNSCALLVLISASHIPVGTTAWFHLLSSSLDTFLCLSSTEPDSQEPSLGALGMHPASSHSPRSCFAGFLSSHSSCLESTISS